MVLHANLVEVDAVVGSLDARVGQVLVAIREIERPFRAEAIADSQVIAELEAGAEALVTQGSYRQEVGADSQLSVQTREVVPVHAEYGSQPDLGNAVVLPRQDVVAPPVAEA